MSNWFSDFFFGKNNTGAIEDECCHCASSSSCCSLDDDDSDVNLDAVDDSAVNQVFTVTIDFIDNTTDYLVIQNVANFLIEEDETTGNLILDLDMVDSTVKRYRINKNSWKLIRVD